MLSASAVVVETVFMAKEEDLAIPEERGVVAEDFNDLNDVAIFMGPLLSMHGTVKREEISSLMERGERFILLSVLDGPTHERGHIRNSINIPVDFIERDAPALIGKDDRVIVYSYNDRCAASAVGADKLATLGYTNVLRYPGGIKDWEKAGLPVEAGAKAPVVEAEGLKKAA